MKPVMIDKYKIMLPLLNEKQKRIYLATEAIALGYGGIKSIHEKTGVSKATIHAGINEIRDDNEEIVSSSSGIRRKGGGRKPITSTYPGIKEALERLVDDSTYGDPEKPLSWTTKSIRKLAEELRQENICISYRKVAYLLSEMGYSLQMNQKKYQVGEEHPDRNEQFKHINEKAKEFGQEGSPVISIDCKKKELVGLFKNSGSEWARKGEPICVLDHDFPLADKGKAAPYGVYDIAANEGYVNVGISSDTAQFAVASIRNWWNYMGVKRYPNTRKLMITADGGGSNGSRNRLWKVELQKLADETNLEITVCHFPPGTSKWNKIEHRMFSQISKNWRGRPLESLEVIVSLIEATTTKNGLKIKCGLDLNKYQTGIKTTEQKLAEICIEGDQFHPNWNYTILPHKRTK